MPDFKGPLFLVGMPRSGTKLLRDLLNRHPCLGIPEIETHFIPYFLNRYQKKGPLTNAHLQEVYRDFEKSRFYWHMCQRGQTITPDEFLSLNRDLPIQTVILNLLRFYGTSSPSTDHAILGDKTPLYVRYISLLKAHFPAARFIHIIRDPRDCALSAMNVWGHHPYRTAHRWKVAITEGREAGSRLGSDYIEVQFEHLLLDPESTMRAVCDVLECTFVPEMMTLSKPAEQFGHARHQVSIMQSNMNKFHSAFSSKRIKRMEEITYKQLITLDYRIYYAQGYREMNPFTRRILHLIDTLSSIFFHLRTKGISEGLRYMWRRRKDRGRRPL